MRAAYVARHPAGNFAAIEPYLGSEEDCASYRELALKLDSTEGSARLLVYRLRRKFRELLEAEVAKTVKDPTDVPGELAWLREVLARQ